MPKIIRHNQNSDSDWIGFEKSIIESREGKSVARKYAIARWRERVKGIREEYEDGNVAHVFTSSEVLEAARKYHTADIARFEATYEVKLAREALAVAEKELRVALARHDGFLLDEEEGDQLVPEMLAIVRKTKADEVKRLRGVIEFARLTAQAADGEHRNAVPRPKGPGLSSFASDLLEFIEASGEQGCATIRRICESVNVASRVKDDPEVPPPLRFLARLVVDTNDYMVLSVHHQPMGFRP